MTTEHQIDCGTKNANNRFLSKIWEYWTDEHLCIVKLESGGQQLPFVEKNLSGNSFNLKKSTFFIKSTKNICFYPNHRMFNSYTFALSRIKIKSLDSTINKRKKISLYPIQPGKKIFYQKITKNTAFWPKMSKFPTGMDQEISEW